MIFFLVSTVVFLLAYTYVGKRLLNPAPLSKRIKKWAWIALLILPFLLPLSFLLRFEFPANFAVDVIGWSAYLTMGFFSLVVVILFVRDLIYLPLWIRGKMSPGKKQQEFDPARRRFIRNTVNVSALGLSAVLTGYGLYEARRRATLEEIEIAVTGDARGLSGLRVVQFTDLHAGPTIKEPFVRDVVEQINALHPDIIIFTGDLVDGSVADLRSDVAPLADLIATRGKFFVTGNHEYYSGALPWIEEAERLGMTVLLNDNRILQVGSSTLLVGGVTDYSAGGFIAGHASDPLKAGIASRTVDYKILLAHQPVSIFKAHEAGFDLQISGHTHGGQYFPWSYLVTLSQPFVAGLHRYKKTSIYVNRGTGYWGPPLRLGIPSEVTLFKFKSV